MFTSDELKNLHDINNKLNLNMSEKFGRSENIIFVYCPPKVGSTTLVTSIRISAAYKYTVLHIHDDVTLQVMANINNITVNQLIKYNKQIGKNIVVIDIYRSPVERKISQFFEEIAEFHFNNTEENVKKYSISRLTERFNKLFPYLGDKDYYTEKYGIPKMQSFDFEKKYLLQEIDGIKYVKLRLKDSDQWSQILENILGTEITIVNDYTTSSKSIANLYNMFNNVYRLPIKYFKIIKECNHLQYYYSKEEQQEYLNTWQKKISNTQDIPYTPEEYKFYQKLSLENQYYSKIQFDHYIDLGCLCKPCALKRSEILNNAKKREPITEKIDHVYLNNEYNKYKQGIIQQQVNVINAINMQKQSQNKNKRRTMGGTKAISSGFLNDVIHSK